MSIYTKKGDNGETDIFNKKRVSKDSLVINALGALDEANSWLGVVGGFTQIQKNLMVVSSLIAGAKSEFPRSKTTRLEKEINQLEKKLPKLTDFIVPAGKGAKLHYARALVRRAERAVVAIPNLSVYPLLAYLNRLSDYLYLKAREISSKNATINHARFSGKGDKTQS